MFGDSITFGIGPADPSHGYAYLLAAAQKWVLIDKAVSGSQAADQADAIYATTTVAQAPYTYMIGTNDNIVYGANADQTTIFREAHLIELAWLGLPANAKITGHSANVNFSGSWVDSIGTASPGYGIGRVSSTQGDTLSFSVSGKTIYLGTIVSYYNRGQFSLSVDGTSQGNYNCYPAAPVDTYLNRVYSPKGIRITGLTDGPHQVTLTVTSDTNPQNKVFFDWAAGTGNVSASSLPVVYAANVPRQSTDAGPGYTIWDYSNIIASNVRTLAGDGLNINYVDAASYINQSTDLVPDGIHPNDTGEQHLEQSFLDALARSAANSPVQVGAAGIVNAFSGKYAIVSPGEIVTIYGRGLGPASAATGGFDATTRLLPSSLGGVSVTFNGVPAPLYYAVTDQLNVQVPYEVSGLSTADLVVTNNGAVARLKVAVGAVSPGLSTAVFNQDNTLNSPANPAPAGSTITMFGTGQGVTQPPSPTGGYPQNSVYPMPAGVVQFAIGFTPAAVQFDGQAPFTAGVMQLNLIVPANAAVKTAPSNLAVTSIARPPATIISPPVMVYIK